MSEQQTTHRVDRARVVWRQTGQEIVVLDTVGAVYYGLDRSGALLWELLVTGTPESELVARLVRDAPVDPAQARKDVHTFLTELRRHGLLEPV